MFASNPYAEWYQNSLCVSDTRTCRYHRATYGTVPGGNAGARFRGSGRG